MHPAAKRAKTEGGRPARGPVKPEDLEPRLVALCNLKLFDADRMAVDRACCRDEDPAVPVRTVRCVRRSYKPNVEAALAAYYDTVFSLVTVPRCEFYVEEACANMHAMRVAAARSVTARAVRRVLFDLRRTRVGYAGRFERSACNAAIAFLKDHHTATEDLFEARVLLDRTHFPSSPITSARTIRPGFRTYACKVVKASLDAHLLASPEKGPSDPRAAFMSRSRVLLLANAFGHLQNRPEFRAPMTCFLVESNRIAVTVWLLSAFDDRNVPFEVLRRASAYWLSPSEHRLLFSAKRPLLLPELLQSWPPC